MRIVFATTRGAGHIGPLLPFAQACVRAGHEVLVAGPGSAAAMVGKAGLRFRAVGEPPAAELAAAWAPVWSKASAPGAEHVISELFVGLNARAALPGMLEAISDWRADLVVRETCEFASLVAAEHLAVPQAQVGIHLSSHTDTGEHLLAFAAPALDRLRVEAGLTQNAVAARARAAGPVLTCAPRSLDDLSAPASPRVRRFRDPDGQPAEPPREEQDRHGDPLVYVSFGSEAPASEYFPDLYRAAAEALGELPVRALITIGHRRDPAELGRLPRSVRVERWVPQAAVMPHAAAMVGHGGSGSTLLALGAGVPLALVPLFVDGPANAHRVAAIGAGIALEQGLAGVSGLAAAVSDLLDDSRYSRAAGRVADEIRALPPVDDAVDVLVEAAEGRRGAQVPAGGASRT